MPELTTGQALNKALSLILEQNPTALLLVKILEFTAVPLELPMDY